MKERETQGPMAAHAHLFSRIQQPREETGKDNVYPLQAISMHFLRIHTWSN